MVYGMLYYTILLDKQSKSFKEWVSEEEKKLPNWMYFYFLFLSNQWQKEGNAKLTGKNLIEDVVHPAIKWLRLLCTPICVSMYTF